MIYFGRVLKEALHSFIKTLEFFLYFVSSVREGFNEEEICVVSKQNFAQTFFTQRQIQTILR